jgi:hypothetical protein
MLNETEKIFIVILWHVDSHITIIIINNNNNNNKK